MQTISTYLVNKKGTDKYLRTSNYGYGNQLSLTDLDSANHYTSKDEAREDIKRYVQKTKRSDCSMFSIQKVEITFNVKEEESMLQDNVCINLAWYGVTKVNLDVVDENWVKETIKKQFKVEAKSFKYDIWPVNDYYYNCYVRDIIWNC